MGVPKFYRWVSERYPCLSEVVKEFQLPEFDNLYLDMNGIVHVCSHPDDDNPHFRITEEKIFKDICHYIDFLFRMIKPRKVFFMAIDGVAPRAKMNQQRGRRFRSAREAELLIKKAEDKGEVLPTEKRFDSNCITPGTPFMVRLQEHLKYFVVDKISNDPLWQGPKIYLSGHETPGEGEHKVMDYIRFSRSHPDHDPDTRHCLYGLDADLIMLGLASHEPHFSLLREEVRFGGKKDRNKRPATPEETTFHLLHLSLMRDYLAYEFSPVKDKLPFPWDLESIIDDWILMGFLVGNDFIPHLPHLHIHHDALPLLWRTYMKVLPTLDGYINEGGHLNLPRFEKYFQELSKFDEETFESAFSDLRFLESKLGGKSINESVGASRPRQKMRKLKKFKVRQNGNPFCALEDESANNDALSDEDSDSEDDESDADDEEEDDDEEEEEEEDYNTFGDEFKLHKRDYYMTKMDYAEVTPDVLKDQAHGYVVAIQWILLYYYEGCPSWSWFYAHHYAPYISDVKGFSDMKITFELSKPFLPFQQLMAVLPAASKDLLPPALQQLMTEATSPVVDFYPVNFETDLNGKQQDWEAVVLIPFIEEERLLAAMGTREPFLTKDEKDRNKHGPHLVYQYTPENMGFYPSSMPGIFPDIHLSRAKRVELHQDLFHIESSKLRKGLLDTVRLDVYFPGFPTLRFLPHTHELAKAGVKVFQHNSRGENMVLRVQSKEGLRLEELADDLLGDVTHVGWPHLHEAKVVSVANESFRIDLIEDTGKKRKQTAVSFSRRKLEPGESTQIASEAATIKEKHMDRFAIDVGNTEVMVYAKPMTGRTYTYGAQGALTLEKQFAANETAFLYQMTVKDLEVEESGLTSFRTLEEVFPENSTVFMVGNPHYGAQGKVKEILADNVRIRIVLEVKEEPDFRNIKRNGTRDRYLNNYQAAQQIGIDSHIMARITGSVFVEKSGHNAGKVNIGLNLKFTKRGEEVPGYTRKTEHGWSYSYKCVKAVEDYIASFPDLWVTVQKQTSNLDVYKEEKLFPEDSETKLADVVKYLEELPCTKAPRMKFGAEILDEDQVKEIEEMTAKLNTTPDIVKMKVKPRLLFRPLANQGSLIPDPGTDFYLKDRVVVVKMGYSVPYGKRGTIIGLPSDEEGVTPNSLYDIVFDEPFPGGITLRCSPSKGYRVPGSAMLNITYGEFRKKCAESPQTFGGRGEFSNQHGSVPGQSGAYRGNGGSNNNNMRGGRQLFNDRAGQYSDRAAMWKQQQQQPQQFQQQPVRWEKGQPLFGQMFAGQNQYSQGSGLSGDGSQPRFIAPKVQGSQGVLTSRGMYQTTQKNHSRSDNSEFDNMWKNLQSHQNTVQGNKSLNPERKPQGQSHPSQSVGQNISLLSRPNLIPSQPAGLVGRSMVQAGGQPQSQAQSGPGLLPTPAVPPGRATSHMMGGYISTAEAPSMASRPDKQSTPQVVQNLFDTASKAQASSAGAPENLEFLAMFNCLQTSTEEVRRGNTGNQPAEVSGVTPSSVSGTATKADQTLKQLLKIGVETSAPPSTASGPSADKAKLSPRLSTEVPSNVMTSSVPAEPSKSPRTAYRQLNLEELFEQVNRQQKEQQSAKMQEGITSQPSATPGASKKPAAKRDPIAELEAYCQSQGSPHFEYEMHATQNAVIANVILPNGQRYQGSLCSTKEEAAKSAASMAMLCLNTKNTKPIPTHPVFANYRPGVQRQNVVNRFFSPNSAFSPIGMPAPNPNLVSCAPPVSGAMLLKPQHFINQPPPSHPLHQLLHQQQQGKQSQAQWLQQQHQQQQQQNLLHRHQGPQVSQEHHQRYSQQRGSQSQSSHSFQFPLSQTSTPLAPSQSAALPHVNTAAPTTTPTAVSSTTTASSSSISQQFIPLQVSRNQKTPSKRKDSTGGKSETATGLPTDTPAPKPEQSELHLVRKSSTQLEGKQDGVLHATITDFTRIVNVKDSAAKLADNLPENRVANISSGTESKDSLGKNGVVPGISSPLSVASTSSDVVSASATSTGKPAQRQKKSRLAANFGPRKR